MRSIALGLDLDENFFDKMINEQCHNLRLLSYPPIQTALLEGEGQARAGAHTGMSISLPIMVRYHRRWQTMAL
jgi:isopenicillin N synthase-like dioxygenase